MTLDGARYAADHLAVPIEAISILWLNAGLSCDGDTIAMTAATQPSIEDVLRGAIPWIPKVTLVNAFLAMENGLFFAATSATYGMPMVVELGIALDVLVGAVIFGVFFFQIRERFDSLDLRNLEELKEE